jgi:ribose transport system substrate-binding protein
MSKNTFDARVRAFRSLALLCLALVTAFAVAYGNSSASAKTTRASAAAAGCGSVPNMGYKDLSGVLKTLPASVRANFNGYPSPIYKSAYAHIKPKKGKITVGMAVEAPINPDNVAFVNQIQGALHRKGIKNIKLLTTTPTGLTQQLSQVNSLIDQHVSYLIVEPIASAPFVPLAQRAEKAGIPFISIVNAVPSPDSINISPNSVLDGASAGAKLAKQIGGKGLVLGVHAVPGVAVDTQTFAGFAAAFKLCPHITQDTSINGYFEIPVAKGATLGWLSSHPGAVAGEYNTAGMGLGIIQAFQQAGRPLPKMVAAGEVEGELATYLKNPSAFSSAYTIPPDGVGKAVGYTISQLIAGHGPKISELASPSFVINPSGLKKYVSASTSVTSQNPVYGIWDPKSYLAEFFNN